MSGTIRQAIGLTKKRITDALNKYKEIKQIIDEGPDKIEENDELYEIFETIVESFEKLRTCVDRLQNLDQQWKKIISKLESPLKEEELDVQKTYIETYGDFRTILQEGQQAVDHVRRRINWFRQAVATRLQLEDMGEDPISEGTLSSLPQGEEIFPIKRENRKREEERDQFKTPPGTPSLFTNEEGIESFASRPKEIKIIPTETSALTDFLFLPPVTIPDFNGNPSTWKEFWDLFEAMVAKRNLPDCIKLFHLKSHLKGEAALSLSNIGNSNEDYAVAIKTLFDLFGDAQRVTHRLRSEILHYQPRENTPIALYKDWARLNQLYSQLRSMGDPTDSTLMAQVLETKFPRYILQKIHRGQQGLITGSKMLAAIGESLRNEANLDRMMADNKGNFLKRYDNKDGIFHKDRYQNKGGYQIRNDYHNKKPPYAQVHMSTEQNKGDYLQRDTKDKPMCNFCGQSHLTFRCMTYTESKDRRKLARENKLCINCLQKGHFYTQCPSDKKCRHCQQKHHSSLCYKIDSNALSTPPKRVEFREQKPLPKNRPLFPSSPKKEATHAIINEESNQNSNKDQTFLSTSYNDLQKTTLLMTGQVNVFGQQKSKQSAEVTLFVDNGSTRSYITENLADTLQLKPKTEREIRINTFGDQDIKPKMAKVYTLNISPKNKIGKALEIEAIALPKLTCPILIAKKEGVMEKPLPTQWKKPDILLGMDYAEEIEKTGERITLPSGFLLSNTSVGTFIYGKGHSQIQNNPVETYHAYPQTESIDTKTIQSHSKAIMQKSFIKLIIDNPINTSDTKEWIGGSHKYATLFTKRDPNYEVNQEITCCSIREESNPQEKKPKGPYSTEEERTIQRELVKFWSVEHLGVLDDCQITDDNRAFRAFQQSIQRAEDGRYICSWPWKTANPTLPTNFKRCLGRLKSTLNRLKKEPELMEKYGNTFTEQLKQGVIEEVHYPAKDGPIHYIPHQIICTPQKTTTKVRVVYDASCKTSNGTSLNDHLYRGPVLLPNLIGMLLRFRITPIPLLADVEKAFLQLELKLSDRDSTRFLWLKDTTKEPEGANLIVYRFARVPFGVVSSPFLLAATIDHHLQNYPHKLAWKMRSNSYVDNILIENDTTEQAIEAYHTSRQIFREAKMNLREYQTSNQEVKNFLLTEGVEVPEIVKVLGINWHTNDDTLAIQQTKFSKQSLQATKRDVLKIIASIFDPLGLLCPLLVRAKLFMQQLWKEKRGWDQQLTAEEENTWNEIKEEIINSPIPIMPRMILTSQHKSYQLHILCDASTQAYCAVAYLRPNTIETAEIGFIMGKTRVNPLKEITLPRMELLGALVASTLAKNIKQELTERIEIIRTIIWSDSQIILSWITGNRTHPTFIHNRITTIWKNIPNAEFRYVPTKENPADWATRSLNQKERQNSTWITGPKWLRKSEDNWPKQAEFSKKVNEIEEIETMANIENKKYNTSTAKLIDFKRFRSWSKIVNTLMIVLTFIRVRIKKRRQGLIWEASDPEINHISKFGKTELIAFRLIQAEFPPDTKQIRELRLNTDNKTNLLRGNTRLLNSNLNTETINPIYLPGKSHGTKLYILHVHKTLHHASSMTTLCTLRLRVWVPKARRLVKDTINQMCFVCRQPKPFQLADFPAYPSTRVLAQAPFAKTGVDYGGPISLKSKGPSEITKCWICLFTCLTSRAIHLEAVFDLTPNAFLQAIRRFVSRRGAPDEIWSDNSTTFKATAKVLIETWVGEDEIQFYFSSQGIKWHFITEAAPWQGGAWERMIGLTKTALKKAVGRKQLTIPEILTYLAETEAVINSRPLVYVPSDENMNIIRPIDCIQPGARIGIPALEPMEFDETYNPNPTPLTKLINTWRNQQTKLNKFWEIWQTDYLLNLSERTQNTHKQGRSLTKRNPEPGEVVIIKQEGLVRGQWKLAKVLEVISPRKVKLQLSGNRQTIVFRPPNSLLPLELSPEVIENTSEEAESALTEQNLPATEERNELRRSARIRARNEQIHSHFIELIVLLSMVAFTEAQSAIPNTTSTTKTDLTTICTENSCAPWRWHCCSYTQRIGTLIWAWIIISILPTTIIIIKGLIMIGKILLRLVKFLRTKCKRRNIRNEGQRTDGSRRRRLRRLLLMILALIITIKVPRIYSCSEVASISADANQCTIDDETNLETCEIKKTSQLSIRPIGEAACLKITTANGNTETMVIQTNSIKYQCNYKAYYWTRDFDAKVESVHRCRQAAGSNCFDDYCENVKSTSDINEFSQEVRSAPGHSHCTRSCAGLGCHGCGLLDPSCLFWRLYAKPISESNYEIGACPTWTLRINVKISVGNISHTIELIPATPTPIFNSTMTLQSVTIPQTPILSQTFLKTYNGEPKAAIVAASSPGQPTAGTIGTLQCPHWMDSWAFKCTFPESICSCTPSLFSTACECNYKNPNQFIDKEEFRLPMHSGPLTIEYDSTPGEQAYFASLSQQSGIILHVKLDNVSLSNLYYKAKCEIIVEKQLTGCRACHEGATAQIRCTAKLSTTANIRCGSNNRWAINCQNQSEIIRISTIEENYDVNCSYQCTDKTNKTFQLKGHLTTVTIEPYQGRDIGGVWMKPAADVPIDQIFKDISNGLVDFGASIFKFVLNNPLISILIVIVIIIVAFIAYIVFRIVLTTVFPTSALTQVLPLLPQFSTKPPRRSVATREFNRKSKPKINPKKAI